MTDPSAPAPPHPYTDCLADTTGAPLKLDPNNRKDGAKLNFLALPHFKEENKILDPQRQAKFRNLPKERKQNLEALIKGKNQPVPINDEHELSYLYLAEYYNKHSVCSLPSLDPSALLNILVKCSTFHKDIQAQAGVVRDAVRNQWAHACIPEWNDNKTNDAFSQMKKLALLMPNSTILITELGEDKLGSTSQVLSIKESEEKEFLLRLSKYRTCIKDNQNEKIKKKIDKLSNEEGEEIYLNRKLVHATTGEEFSSLEEILVTDRTVLVKAVAGAGKSTFAAMTMQEWSERKILKNITCCLFLAAGSEEKVAMCLQLWDETNHVMRLTRREAEEAFPHLQNLADRGELAILFDGLDEFGLMTKKDIDNASKAALDPTHEVDMKTLCVGVLSKKILSGAKVLATGRNTDHVNKELLGGEAIQLEFVDLKDEDLANLIKLMEGNKDEQIRIQTELERVSSEHNEFFMKTPMMMRMIVTLIIERKVKVEETQNSSEIYLMILLKNLCFQKGEGEESFLELDPPEHQDFLISCLKLCQKQIQKGTDDTNVIMGLQKNIKGLGQCFETKASGETLQIPVSFIKHLGIFHFRKEAGKACLEALHLSFLEFGCAASLCRTELNIQEELNTISNWDRLKAVTRFLSGMLSRNNKIEFLNNCKNLCENFLDLLGREQMEDGMQQVFSFLTHYKNAPGTNLIEFKTATKEKVFQLSLVPLLSDAMEQSAQIIPELDVRFEEIYVHNCEPSEILDMTVFFKLLGNIEFKNTTIGNLIIPSLSSILLLQRTPEQISQTDKETLFKCIHVEDIEIRNQNNKAKEITNDTNKISITDLQSTLEDLNLSFNQIFKFIRSLLCRKNEQSLELNKNLWSQKDDIIQTWEEIKQRYKKEDKELGRQLRSERQRTKKQKRRRRGEGEEEEEEEEEEEQEEWVKEGEE